MILSELDYEFSGQSKDDSPEPNAIVEVPVNVNGEPPSPISSTEVQNEIGQLRAKLLPLVAIEDVLASELSGGVSVSGGRTGAYVRSGWQALVTSNWALSDSRSSERTQAPEVIALAAKTLGSTTTAIEALWNHRTVKRLLHLRKLRLDESASLSVFLLSCNVVFFLQTLHLPNSFLEDIERIAEPDYVPTNSMSSPYLTYLTISNSSQLIS
jgi:hypothetical protein